MTNGEKLVKTFPDIELYKKTHGGIQIDFDSTWWNAEYKEPTIKNDLGVDCIDRAQAQTEIEMNAYRYTLAKERGGAGEVEWNSHLIDIDDAVDIIRNLPSVTPQEPKTGYWISTETKGVRYAFWCRYKCSLCGGLSDRTTFCPNCGARMVEPQESEG